MELENQINDEDSGKLKKKKNKKKKDQDVLKAGKDSSRKSKHKKNKNKYAEDYNNANPNDVPIQNEQFLFSKMEKILKSQGDHPIVAFNISYTIKDKNGGKL